MKEADRFPTDDITWCWSDCVTDCPRQPKYIRDNSIPHSFANFSSKCVAYTPKEQTMSEKWVDAIQWLAIIVLFYKTRRL